VTSYLLAGGGTAGHVNPLLAVADGLREREPAATVLVLGTKEGLEARLVPQRGYELLIVDKVPFPRRPNRQAVGFPSRLGRAVRQVRQHIRANDVDIVVGFGGYASAPAYIAARRENVPFVVHEANARPGLANRLGAGAAAGIGVAFAGTPLKSSEVVGMPLRREIVALDRAAHRVEAAEAFGAQRLNEALADSWADVLAAGWQLLHITGERSELIDPEVPGYAMRRYVDRMDLAFSLADLIVSRAGSATVSEISALGIPAVYVPYAVGNGEQRLNAASAVAAGAAILLDDRTFSGDTVRAEVIPLLGDPGRISTMAAAAEKVGTRTGTENVIAMIDRALDAAR
jgi:UDP-N-acetylglucosamine--N-acetylmuramyl-(pentapeptide) pyrophosphoryl-undecaprenol N-acetylglucosamine transferase